MQSDFLLKNNGISTYFAERGEMCKSNMKIQFQYKKVEHDIKEANDISELKKKYELNVLDDNTKLTELKYDQIRVIYFIYIDGLFVYLGTFLKKSGKTPQNQIDKNNERIKKYKENHKNESNRQNN